MNIYIYMYVCVNTYIYIYMLKALQPMQPTRTLNTSTPPNRFRVKSGAP